MAGLGNPPYYSLNLAVLADSIGETPKLGTEGRLSRDPGPWPPPRVVAVLGQHVSAAANRCGRELHLHYRHLARGPRFWCRQCRQLDQDVRRRLARRAPTSLADGTVAEDRYSVDGSTWCAERGRSAAAPWRALASASTWA